MSSKKFMGLFNKLPDPVKLIVPDESATMGANILNDKPLSPQDI